MINVLIVDDHDIVRSGISRLLGDTPGIHVSGLASSGEEAIILAKSKRPDVILMDVCMPGIGGLEATRKMLRSDPQLKIIALTVYGEEPFPSKLLQAGAAGYLTKGSGVEQMLTAIKTVHFGQRFIDPKIAQQLALNSFKKCNSDNPLMSLSERELQIMIMITSGTKVAQISAELHLSPKTVNTYRYRLFEKLGISSDVELTHVAMRHGLLDNVVVTT